MDKQTLNISQIKESGISKNTSDNSKSKTDYKMLLTKIFNKKNIKILVLLIIGIIAMILFVAIGDGGLKKTTTSSTTTTKSYITTLEYCKSLEDKLESVLSRVSGAGSVSVMISVEGSLELVYATSDDNKTSNTTSGSTITSSTNPIIVQSNGNASPLILTENLPEVKGVIVVSSGAKDVSIKLDILNAVSTLLNISTDKISVLKGI